MAKVTFIGLYDTLDKALSIRTSPEIDFYSVHGINILPNSTEVIRQSTNNNIGVSIEVYTAYLVNLRTGVETDITDKFFVETMFQDDNGFNQVTWTISNLPDSFGTGLNYIKVNQTLGQDYYSNPFTIDSSLSDKTALFHYKDRENELSSSISLLIWFVETVKNVELKNYYEISTKNTVTLSVKSNRFEKWKTDIIGRDLALLISDMLELKFVYLDKLRVNLFEAMDMPEFASKSQTKRYVLKLNVNNKDVFSDVLDVPIVPLVPNIILNSITTNGFLAFYNFTLENIDTQLLTFEYSSDQINWISENKGVTSPQSVSFSEIGTWFFRVRHPLAISNTVEFMVDSTLIANNDTAQVSKGAFVNIPVLFNDTLTGNVSITNVTQPQNGTATINVDKTIRYQHGGGTNTFDTFQYTISNGVTQATATVNVTITQTVGTSTPFSTSLLGSSSPTTACGFNLSVIRFHTGANSLPTLDDFVFNDSGLTMPVVGSDQFFAIANGRTIQINNNGRVTNLFICSGGFG